MSQVPRFASSCLALFLAACASKPPPPVTVPDSDPAPESTASSESSASDNEFYSEMAGFRITKPDNWVFGTIEQEEANRERVSTGNEQTDEAVRQARVPLVVIMRHPEPIDEPNPSLKVLFRELPKGKSQTPEKLAQIVAAGMKQMIPSFELDGEITDAVVGGLPAAHFRSKFTVQVGNGGESYPVRSRTWMVPREGHLFVIAASYFEPVGEAEGAEDYERIFEKMIQSVVIRN